MPSARKARFRGVRGGAPALSLLLALAFSGSPGRADPPKPSTPSTPSTGATSSPATAAADEAREKRERQARAIEFHNEAKALYERGHYRRAIAKLEAAITLDPDGKELVYNLALIHEKLAEAEVAEKYYRRYVEMETDPKAREKALAVVKRLEGAKKTLKGDVPDRVSPSSSASASAAPAMSSAVAAPTRRMPSPMVFVMGGVAVAAVGAGIGFGVSAFTTNPQGAMTGPRTSVGDLETRADAAHTQAIVADFAFVTSFVVAAAATVLYLLESRSPQATPSAAPAGAIQQKLRTTVPF